MEGCPGVVLAVGLGVDFLTAKVVGEIDAVEADPIRLKEQASSCTGAPVTAWPMDSWQLWAIAGAVGLSPGGRPSPRSSSDGAINGSLDGVPWL